jgi:hypothetical protein
MDSDGYEEAISLKGNLRLKKEGIRGFYLLGA